MIIGSINGCNKKYVGPPGSKNVSDLHVKEWTDSDGNKIITSAWFPTLDEVRRMQMGQPIHLHIVNGGHPIVAMTVPEE